MPSYVVAGASRGLGLEFVIQLLSKGNTVIALARNPATATGLTEIKDKNLHIVKADVHDIPSLKAAVEETIKITGGTLDVLINNAAYQNPSTAFIGIDEFPSEEELVEDFNAQWATNVLGPILTTNAFLPLLKKGSIKKVMTLGSGLGDPGLVMPSGWYGSTAYCTTKCALEMVNKKYAVKFKDEGFVFLLISPGVVNTQERTPPPEIMAKIGEMAAGFKKVYPHWQGPIEPAESVELCLGVLDKVTVDDTGAFLSHLGTREWL